MATTITEYLVNKLGFRKYDNSPGRETLDWDKWSCVLRVHDLHYLFFSEDLKHFTLAVKNDKGGPAGTFKPYTTVMIPMPISTTKDAKNLIKGIVNYRYVKCICQ